VPPVAVALEGGRLLEAGRLADAGASFWRDAEMAEEAGDAELSGWQP
jgi:hypothetical protein